MAETKTRSIILTADEVRAILDGRKTQIRRVVKPQPAWNGKRTCRWLDCNVEPEDQRYGVWTETRNYPCPYGVPSERMWVKETWCPVDGDPGADCWIDYRATPWDSAEHPAGWQNDPGDPDALKWRSAVHMPRYLGDLRVSRLDVDCVGVQVERNASTGLWEWAPTYKRAGNG